PWVAPRSARPGSFLPAFTRLTCSGWHCRALGELGHILWTFAKCLYTRLAGEDLQDGASCLTLRCLVPDSAKKSQSPGPKVTQRHFANRTHTGAGTSTGSPTCLSAPVFGSMRKTTIVPLPWFSARR